MAVKLELGQLFITPGANTVVSALEVNQWINRHAMCDWGDVCEDDHAQNDWAVTNHARVLSVYEASSGEAVWIITEADRSATTVLLPSEY